MKIGLWGDNVNFPSLPLMKISAYHKKKGDDVSFIKENDQYDRVYISKSFNLPMVRKIPSLDYTPNATEVVKGGTGFAIKVDKGKEVYHKELDPSLPSEIESSYPDYELYPQYKNMAVGFLTKGCPNDCGFCIVSKKEGCRVHQVGELDDFWRDQREIKLLDPNLLAFNNREVLLESLVKTGVYIDYTQGLDARFITDSIAKLISKTKIKVLHFAFDSMKHEKQILRGLDIFRKHCSLNERRLKVYVLTNYNTTHEEDWYRVRKIRELGYTPYVMIYQKGTHDRFLTDLARWCNSQYIYRSCKDFGDYVPRVDEKSAKELYPKVLGVGK